MAREKEFLLTIRRWRRAGVPLNYAAVRRKDSGFFYSAFAGNPKTLKAIRDRLANNRGSRKMVQEKTPTLHRAAIHYFGTWEKAVHMARGF